MSLLKIVGREKLPPSQRSSLENDRQAENYRLNHAWPLQDENVDFKEKLHKQQQKQTTKPPPPPPPPPPPTTTITKATTTYSKLRLFPVHFVHTYKLPVKGLDSLGRS